MGGEQEETQYVLEDKFNEQMKAAETVFRTSVRANLQHQQWAKIITTAQPQMSAGCQAIPCLWGSKDKK
jgi:hypothetical protein